MDMMKLLTRKRDLFKSMKAISEQQKAFIMEGRMEAFLESADQRTGLQDEIEEIDREIEIVRRKGDPVSPGRDLGLIVSETADLIRLIQETDRETETILSGKRDDLLSQIQGVRTGRKALKGYGGKRSRDPKFIDRQS